MTQYYNENVDTQLKHNSFFKQTSQCVESIDIVFLWMQNCQCVLNHKWKNTNPSLIKLKWPILPTWKAFIFFLCHAVYGLSVLWLWNTKFCHSCILKTPDRSFLWPPHKINTSSLCTPVIHSKSFSAPFCPKEIMIGIRRWRQLCKSIISHFQHLLSLSLYL